MCNGYRYSTLWAYPLITEICLEGNAEGISAGQMTFSQRSPDASASEAASRPGSACLRDTTLLHGTAAGICGLRRLQTGRLRRALGWARLPAGCCFHVPNLCDGIPEPSVIWTSSMEGSVISY